MAVRVNVEFYVEEVGSAQQKFLNSLPLDIEMRPHQKTCVEFLREEVLEKVEHMKGPVNCFIKKPLVLSSKDNDYIPFDKRLKEYFTEDVRGQKITVKIIYASQVMYSRKLHIGLKGKRFFYYYFFKSNSIFSGFNPLTDFLKPITIRFGSKNTTLKEIIDIVAETHSMKNQNTSTWYFTDTPMSQKQIFNLKQPIENGDFTKRPIGDQDKLLTLHAQ